MRNSRCLSDCRGSHKSAGRKVGLKRPVGEQPSRLLPVSSARPPRRACVSSSPAACRVGVPFSGDHEHPPKGPSVVSGEPRADGKAGCSSVLLPLAAPCAMPPTARHLARSQPRRWQHCPENTWGLGPGVWSLGGSLRQRVLYTLTAPETRTPGPPESVALTSPVAR